MARVRPGPIRGARPPLTGFLAPPRRPDTILGERLRAPSPARVRTRAIRIAQSLHASAKVKLACRKGQGTTEYAILVGVLVVIAILAITVFKPKIQELWDAIASGINGL